MNVLSPPVSHLHHRPPPIIFGVPKIIDCADDQEDLTVTHMRQNLSVRHRFRYFGVIAVFLIITVALCWGLAHI
jgi:hypothetical protein